MASSGDETLYSGRRAVQAARVHGGREICHCDKRHRERCHLDRRSLGRAGGIRRRGCDAPGRDGPAAMTVEIWNRKESETAESLTEVEPALGIERVSHAYGARLALDDVSFTVPCGSFTVLLGLNGAGKSTLFSL